MAVKIRKKPTRRAWDEAQRKASALGYVSFHPYDNGARSLHPYAADNPNNPYSTPRVTSSEKSPLPKSE